MVKIREDKNLIIMTRADTLICTIAIKDADGNDYVPDQNNDQLRFALKRNYDDEEPLILKNIPLDTCQLRLEPEDTKGLEQPGSFFYDVQLTYGDGIVSTIISNAVLKIREEVE